MYTLFYKIVYLFERESSGGMSEAIHVLVNSSKYLQQPTARPGQSQELNPGFPTRDQPLEPAPAQMKDAGIPANVPHQAHFLN